MLVSVSISAYNEENYLPAIFESLVHQTYPHKQIEIVLINAMSTDRTRILMNEFQENYQHEFYAIKIFDNPKKTLNTGLNLGFKYSDGECYLKIDAHSYIPENFIERNVAVIQTGERVCGGRRPTIVETDDELAKTLHIVEESALGSSIANYRKGDESRYVNSVFQGMYHKDVIDKVGYFDEKLVRTEDNEFHYRIRKNGFKIWYDTSIESFQYIRPTYSKMLKQKFGNGYWIGLTSHVCRECLSLFHFVPGVFVSTLLATILLAGISALPFILLVSIYLLAIIGLSLFEITTHPFHITRLLIPLMMISVHLSYGIGTLRGWIEGFWWKKSYFSNIEE
ncbi:glycosyltransferase family 2 protein [Granulicatella sp.]